MLIHLHIDIKWKKEWFPSIPIRSWKRNSDRRQFLDEIKSQFQIEAPSDWGKITTNDIQKAGGSAILKYYKGSLFRCLQSVYPG